MSRYLSINADSDFETLIAELNGAKVVDNSTDEINDTKEIVNVTCIIDKYGVGYIGNQNTTFDGYPCIEWSKNILLYTRYKLRGKNVSENYCRNPDGDSTGPWCFVANRSIFKRHFKFKHCGIPLCKSKVRPPTNQINLGIPMLLKRNCPYGFKKETTARYMTNITYCQVEQEFLSKLPSGQYSFQLLNAENGTACPEGFKLEKQFSPYTYYCTRNDSSNEVIEFPSYLSPKSGELIFVTHKIGSNSSCPQMHSKTSIVIRKSKINFSSDLTLLTCYYFYKLSNKKISGTVDRKLAVLVFQRNCPTNWNVKPMPFKWRFIINMEGISKRPLVYVCIPNEDVYNYPDGDYCLLSSSTTKLSNVQCPEDFLDVDMKINGIIITKFCCRQSTKSGFNNQYLYNYFNFSSILIINSADKCEKSNSTNISVKQFSFEALLYRDNFDCTNCDLFNVFNNQQYSFGRRWSYFKNRFRVCSFEKATNGFGYATLNSRCPPDMNYGYIKYARDRYTSMNSIKVVASFCTIVNYPKNISFPEGKYCVYKIGIECPPGLKTVKSELPMYFHKYSDSGGDITNYQLKEYCCKFGNKSINFENATLPYVSSNFEFGLPFADSSFNCIHGLDTHTAVEDSHMCHYYPTTDNSARISIVFTSADCSYRAYRYYGSYRLIYAARVNIAYCHFYVNDRPPPGNYCAPFSKTCPSTYFYYVTYHPLMQQVICCRKPTLKDSIANESEFTASGWVNDMKLFSLLPYKGKCPVFPRYNYGKVPIKRYYYYTASEMNAGHKKNLTDIGFEVSSAYKGLSLTMYSCDYKLDPYNKSTTWPHGQYAFPKPLTGCPSNFKSGEFTHSMETANPSFAHSDTIHLDGDYMIGGSLIKWSFCVKKDNYVKEKLFLPYGRYCLMKVDYTCPSNFKEGSVKFVELTALDKLRINRTGVLPKIETTGPYITYYFCCQSGRGDVAHDPMYLPTESGSFYLLKYGTYCQKVYGMKSTEEFICIDSEDSQQYLNYTFQAPYKAEGATPVTGSFVRGCDFQINLCYYELDVPVPKPKTPKPGPLVSWPIGSYIFIKPISSRCPPGFDEGSVTVQTLFRFQPKFMHILMFGLAEDNNAIFSYCKRNSTIINQTTPAEDWPSGNYCLIFEKSCPPDMLRHKFRSMEYFVAKKQSGTNMARWSNLCCKKEKTSNTSQLPFFPGDFYSVIIQPTLEIHSCPPHQNARVALIDFQNEILCYYERMDESIEFPVGDYLLPVSQKSMNACAPGFHLVEHHHLALGGRKKPPKVLKFCQKDESGSKNGTFPRGNYCILTSNSKCPTNQFTIENMLTLPLYHFSDHLSKFTRYLACCQRDNRIISNIVMPKIPFRLYGSSPCSYVDGLNYVAENFEETILVQQGGVERPPYSQAEKKLRICEYDLTTMWNFENRCNCHSNASCTLSLEDINCQCKPGYFGDGKTMCVKITNETDKCADVCDKNASLCVKSTLGDHSCNCKEGYAGDGFRCRPSCEKRNCNVFSKCVVDSIESRCNCLPDNIEADNGNCHGDLINTIYHLPGFSYINQLNLSCFSKDAYDHLVIPGRHKFLFILIPVGENEFPSCDNISNYYGFTWRTYFGKDYPIDLNIEIKGNYRLSISRSEENVWTIGKKFKAIRRDIFNNAMVLYMNGSVDLTSVIFKTDELRNKFTKKSVIVFVVSGFVIFVVILAMLFIINRKRQSNVYGRLKDNKSESTIVFVPADDKIEMES